MRSTLASTHTGLAADQKVLVKDVYTVEGTKDNTSVIDVLKDVGGDITKAIRTTPGAAQKITQLAMDAKKGRLDKTAVLSRVGSLLGGTKVLDKLTGPISNGLTSAFGMDPALSKKVITQVTDALGNPQRAENQARSLFDYKNASDVTNAIQRFLGNKDVINQFDLGAEAVMVGELLNQAVRAGIPSAVDVLVRNASSPEQRRYIITRNIAPILFSGDVATMEASISHVSPSVIASLRPNFAQDFLGNFRMPFGTTRDSYLSYKTRILALLNSINPNWPYGQRGGEKMLSLIPFSKMSQDATLVFAMSDEFSVQSMIAGKFLSRPVATMVREQYPYFPV